MYIKMVKLYQAVLPDSVLFIIISLNLCILFLEIFENFVVIVLNNNLSVNYMALVSLYHVS